jgi:hypothetical protein
MNPRGYQSTWTWSFRLLVRSLWPLADVSSFGHFTGEIEDPAHHDVRARPDAECPIPPEPLASLLVGRGGAHDTRQERSRLVEGANRQRVHRLRVAGFRKVAEALGQDLRVSDDRSPEFSNQAKGDLVTRPLASSTQPPSPRSILVVSCNRSCLGACAGDSPCKRWLTISGNTRSAPRKPTMGRVRPTSIKSTCIRASQVVATSAWTTVATASETS